MTKDQLVRLLRDPSKIDEQDFLGLEKLHAEFPYAYPLSLLKLLHLKAQDSYMYQSALSQTALLSPDREKLWKWVEGEDSEVSIESTSEKSAVQESKPVVKPIAEPAPEPTPEPDLPTVQESTTEAIQEPVIESEPEVESPQEQAIEKTDTAPVAETRETEAAKPLDDAPPKKLGDDLSHLPEKVRAVIERSRSIQRKINDAEEIESKVSEGETPDIGLEEVEVAPLETPPSNAADEVGLEILEEEAEFLSFTPQESVQSTEGREEETIEVVEEELEKTPNAEAQPIEVTDADGKHSFSVWLQMTKGEEASEIEETAQDQEQEQDPEQEQDQNKDLAEDLGDITIENPESQEKEKTARPEPKTLDEKMELIDQFIRKPPRFKPNKKNQNTLDMSKISEQSDSSIITETLAQVYRQQKHYDKAIEAYGILRLKYPEKSGLFADRILEIKKLKENK
ncbi:MAG: hypothetical protein SchgKO_13440 [Schleiferiaceae bacterium]